MTVAEPALPRLSRKAWTPCWENLNKLVWAEGFAFTSYGVNLGVRVSDPALLPMLRKRLPPGAKASASKVVERYLSVILGGRKDGSRIHNYNLLYLDHGLLARSFKLDEVLGSFESWARLSVAELTRARVFIHAGVVGWKGQAILVPGQTLTGKTSLVAELVKAGATYYSDEYAVLDGHGRVHPYLKPLSIRQDSAGAQRDVPVEEIGGRAGSKPLPVGLVVMSHYKPGGRWRPRMLSPGAGALALLANTVTARRAPERALTILQRVVASAPVIKSSRGEAAAVAHEILAASSPRS